ncbi:protease HtpX-like protein [Candidatus Kuenenia stuttgartiensis]|jgi:heat shock protein HtpX|uniref:Protease HtpX homolog n=1 Tax=Kuenenia stuttgartiensis TaxID=174633 RepID=Q1Q120_KUEST|nr:MULTISPECIES: zinc metalloprotease HtpX [Kuenenia]MBE7547800.1 zinc metalloprotease HtpX [Planctomycetia bacterium]MCF6152509.1 zinc metalloprotease HtpX [Candidatus Kuenenia stuttgartiensis]MCL4726161.1 zinc metalloprotease HtpX [Candidatus Kuenenia stuttgartiensis]MCZ7623606.1 zinc metalloprotease HtpX [Candidatus Kuenenia sp.]QII10723.1 protease HtpX-like protein [Candidatus Kuenenia stuttgartiensis]
MNYFKTAVLLVVLTLILVWAGSIFGGRQGAVFAFAIAMGMNFFSYWYSDKIVLKIYRARQITGQDSPKYFALVKELTANAALPMPNLYIIPTQAMNAFATGRNPGHAAIAVTEGLLNSLTHEELKGVLAHELSHVKNRDILICTIVATIAGAITMLANMAQWTAMFGGFGRHDDDDSGGGGVVGLIALAIVAPIAALLIQMAISRSREYAADKSGALMARNPAGLASALEKLHQAARVRPLDAGTSSAHLFIVNPLSGRSFASLFSTHPPIEERVKRLRSMA